MAALRDIARDFAAEIRDGIGWTIVYRTGRSWNALTIWSDIWNGEWETDDLNDAIGILKADPDAVIVNGYYCGHFGEGMTIDEIAAGIRWHYEGGHNRLTDYCEVTQGRDTLEEGRKAAEAAGLPFCERLADGGDDELSPYVYDGSMALADHEKMQQAREAFDRLADTLREIAAKLAEAMKPAINAVLSAFKKLWKVSVRAIGVPPKWLHLAAHAKKARTRKKYRNRIRRYVFEALAAEGGGGP
nr:MAG: Large polyvalent-protein-associated domain 15 [Bacteriophage sp.]